MPIFVPSGTPSFAAFHFLLAPAVNASRVKADVMAPSRACAYASAEPEAAVHS
jgi:hypothetical protein